jgi:hypothetical protein
MFYVSIAISMLDCAHPLNHFKGQGILYQHRHHHSTPNTSVEASNPFQEITKQAKSLAKTSSRIDYIADGGHFFFHDSHRFGGCGMEFGVSELETATKSSYC